MNDLLFIIHFNVYYLIIYYFTIYYLLFIVTFII